MSLKLLITAVIYDEKESSFVNFSSMLTIRDPLSQLSQRVLALTMQFAYKRCIALYALLFAAWHWGSAVANW